MGGDFSREEVQRVAESWYDSSLSNTCYLPDVAIDQDFLRYSGTDSNYQLMIYTHSLAERSPTYVSALGSTLAGLAVLPSGAGLGALMIALILDIGLSGSQNPDTTYGVISRVFGEEKASSVRDTVMEFTRRYKTFLSDPERLRQELDRFEARLSSDLTVLRNSLLYDDQMSSRGMKIWVNGAVMHMLMQIHQARLKSLSGQFQSRDLWPLEHMVDTYMQDLERLLKVYKGYRQGRIFIRIPRRKKCYLVNLEVSCPRKLYAGECSFYQGYFKAYNDIIFSRYQPILQIRDHFQNMKDTLDVVVHQHDVLRLPTST